MSTVRSFTLDQIDTTTTTAALSAAYEGYFYPLQFTEAATANYVHVHDIVPEASPVWMCGGAPVAIALLGIRGDRAWVGAFGISPRWRGQGLAPAMFGEVIRLAKKARVRTIQLEVLEENTRARAIYERAGFTIERKLVSWERTDIPASKTPFECTDVGPLLAREVPHAPSACWQREPRTLQRRAAQFAAVQSGTSFAIYGTQDDVASLWKLSLGAESHAVLAGVASTAGVQRLALSNEPEGSPISADLDEQSWSRTATQYEMRIRF